MLQQQLPVSCQPGSRPCLFLTREGWWARFYSEGTPWKFFLPLSVYRVDPRTLFFRRASRGFVLSPCRHMGGPFNIAPSIRAPPGGHRQINFLTILFLVGRPLFGRCFRLSEFHVLLLLLLYHHPLSSSSSSSSPPGVNLSSLSVVRLLCSPLFLPLVQFSFWLCET